MSLRVFHIIFVIATVLLSFFVALWGVREFTQEQSTTGLIVGLLFFVNAIAMIVYGKKVFRKLKELP